MAIPIQNFPILSFQQANPGLTGAGDVMGLAQKIINLQTSGTKADYLQPSLQEKLRQQQITSQFMPQQQQSDISSKQAQTQLLQEQSKYLPLKYAIDLSQNLRASSRFGPSYDLAKTLQSMPMAQKAAWVAQNPQQYNDLVNTMASKAYQSYQDPTSNFLSGIANQYYPGMNTDQSNSQNINQPSQEQNAGTQGQQNDSLNAQMQGQNPPQTLSGQMQGQQPQEGVFSTTPEQQQQFQNAVQLSANRSNTSGQMNGRADSAVALEKFLLDNKDEYSQRLNNAIQYSAMGGKAKKAIDFAKEQMGQPNKMYEDYQWAVHTFRNDVNNQIRMMEKMGATDAQRQDANNLLSAIDSISVNPEGAKNLLNTQISTIQQTSDAIFGAAEPVYKGIYRKTHDIPEMQGNYLDAGKPQTVGEQIPSGNIKVKSPDGKVGYIPNEDIDEAMKEGYTKI